MRISTIIEAPKLQSEVHKQGGFAQQAALGPGPLTSTSAKASYKVTDPVVNEFLYENASSKDLRRWISLHSRRRT